MDDIPLIDSLLAWSAPLLAVLLATVAAIWIALRAIPARTATRIFRQLTILALVLAANVLLVLALPLDPELRGQLLSLFGLVLTAIIALASTTLVANAMAGLMLRAVGSFHPGDYLSIEGHFGRVTEQGLLHTEIQTEDRDLMTLPNLYLISHPVKVVSARGTLVSTDVSLGYDAPRRTVRDALVAGAGQAGLAEPFVQIKGLLDHAVAYRVSGFLEDVDSLVSRRTELNAAVLDSLHAAGLEIVSPAFMNQRQLAPAQTIMPDSRVAGEGEPEPRTEPEQIMFDKAQLAGRLIKLQQERDELAVEIEALEKTAARAGDPGSPEIARRRRQLDALDDIIDTLQKT